jgi:voltage-gated potassium channel Kch
MGLRQSARYRFDNLMARGVGAQILLLAVFTLLLVAITVALLLALHVAPGEDSTPMLAWKSLMHTMDAGTLGGDSGGWTYLFVYLFATIGGIFVVSALIGVLNQGFGTLLEKLRRGRSVVVERNHTVILGWGPKVFTLLEELAEANRNVRRAAVVILADRDKVDMDSEIAEAMRGKRLRVITRRGSTMSVEDLALVSLHTSKAVIVLGADGVDGNVSDTIVLRTLLAVKQVAGEHPLHLVAEVFDERAEPVARMVAGDKAALMLGAPLVSRLLVQTGRQSGLSIVYTELLDFGGCEIYVTNEPKLAGKTFRDAAFAYGTSTLLGIFTASGEMLLPPPFDRVLAKDDLVVTISEDDDKIVLDGASGGIDEHAIDIAKARASRRSERTLVLGASRRLPLVLRELDGYVAPGSETIVYGEGAKALASSGAKLANMKITIEDGDVTSRDLLESLDIGSFDHVLLLSELGTRTQEMADARTTITLLYLRDIARRAGKRVPMTSEILEIQSRDLAAVAEADDFIVSNSLVSLMMSQLSENPHLVHVFGELFSAEGHELYVRPMSEYIRADGATTYATLCEAAMRRNEIAIGYRLAKDARDPAAAYGVRVNPAKRERLTFSPSDQVIVLAEG